jgi:hypothetical protein
MENSIEGLSDTHERAEKFFVPSDAGAKNFCFVFAVIAPRGASVRRRGAKRTGKSAPQRQDILSRPKVAWFASCPLRSRSRR